MEEQKSNDETLSTVSSAPPHATYVSIRISVSWEECGGLSLGRQKVMTERTTWIY